MPVQNPQECLGTNASIVIFNPVMFFSQPLSKNLRATRESKQGINMCPLLNKSFKKSDSNLCIKF